jgi:cell division transport system permease protein
MIRFLAFSMKRAWQGFWRNIVMSLAATATMVLMLLLLAGLLIVVTGLNAGLDYFESKVEVTAFVRDGAPQERVDAVMAEVKGLPQVAGVAFVSKDEAIKRFRTYNEARGQTDLTDVLPWNPLPASIEVDLSDPLAYAGVASTLKDERDVVEEVVENQSVVNALLLVTNTMRLGGTIILGLVAITVFFIVINTIRLAVVARAQEIEIMRLVGASDAFIRWPFVFEGIFVGVLGAVVTLTLLALAYQPLSEVMFALFQVLPLRFGEFVLRDVALVVLGAGIALGGLGSYVSVRSYLGR